MAGRPTGVTDNAPVADTITEVDTIERASPDANLRTTITADPGAAGTTLALTAAISSEASGWKIRVEKETMLVTAGGDTTSLTVTRAQDGSTGVAHGIGVAAARVVAVQRVEPVVASRQVSYMGFAASFRTPGRAATAQNIFSIFNKTGSDILIAVKRMSVQVDQTVVRLTVAPKIIVARSTVLPTNGTALNPVPFDTALTSSANLDLRGDASADGTGSTTTLTSTPATDKAWAQFIMRYNTLVGQAVYPDEPLIPLFCENSPVILRAAQGLLVHIIAAATTDNPATAHYQVNCAWEEYTDA